MRPIKLVFTLAVMTMILTGGATAARAAQVCSIAADCPHGFVCQLAEAVPPTSVDCTKDKPCPAVQPAALFAPGGTCVPATCATDADCGTDMVCHTQTTEACSGGSAIACAPNTKCDPPPPTDTVCTKQTTSSCAYRWQLACNTDSDCGAAFNCVPSTQTTCPTRSGGGTSPSGSSSGAGGSAVSVDVATPPKEGNATGSSGSVAECTSTTSFPGSCQPKATTCTADTDCPSAWTCVELSVPSGGSAVGTGGSTGSDAPLPAEQPTSTPSVGIATDVSTTPPDATGSQKVCVSPYGDFARGGTLTSGGSTGGSASDPTSPTNEKGAPPAADAAHNASSGGGCAVAAHDTADAWSVAAGLALLGLALGSRRRARR